MSVDKALIVDIKGRLTFKLPTKKHMSSVICHQESHGVFVINYLFSDTMLL